MADESRGKGKETKQPADKVRTFLVGLATDPTKLGEFIKDPDLSMEAAELDTEDRALLKSGNPTAIYARLAGQTSVSAMPVTILVVDMTPDSTKEGTNMPSIRSAGSQYPIYPQIPPPIYPQIHPIYPQIQPVFPQISPLQIHPLQIYPQIHPLQIYPQIHPLQIHPLQIYPQIHPLQIAPNMYPQIHPLIQPSYYPQQWW